MVAEPEKTVWIGLEYFCSEGDKYWKLSEEKWVKYATAELLKMGVISSESDVLDSHTYPPCRLRYSPQSQRRLPSSDPCCCSGADRKTGK